MHPRPRVTRRRWIGLKGSMQFAYDDGNRGVDARWQSRVVTDGVYMLRQPLRLRDHHLVDHLPDLVGVQMAPTSGSCSTASFSGSLSPVIAT